MSDFNYILEANKRIPHLTTIKKLCNNELEKYMDMFNYPEPVRLLLTENINEFVLKYPELIKQYYTNPLLIKKMEKEYIKNPVKLMTDVAIGWFTEDLTLLDLNKIDGVVAVRNGTEGRNLYVTEKSITNEPDFSVMYRGNKIYIEFITDFNQSWKYTNKVWLRNNKAINLKKDNTFILGRSLLDDTFIFSIPKYLKTYVEYKYDGKFGRYYEPEYFNTYDSETLKAALIWAITPQF